MASESGVKYKIARRISDIGNAMTYSLLLAIFLAFCIPQTFSPWLVFLVAFLVMVFGPAAVLVAGMKLGKIDFDVSNQNSRNLFYLIIEGFYVAGTIIFSSLVMPSWVFFNIGIVSVSLNGLLLLINFKWKISAHAAGAAGPTTGFAFIFGWWTLIITVPCVIAIIWSRFYLKKHTIGQLIAGTAFAVIIYSVVFAILYPLSLF
ncbi:MAG TPA: hypothetical protein VKM55_21615 [Candidatus Lokiarchaeia archaeon]|nr:hypothetical protein [Candidatus Lokiarchaeia archaeon]